MIEDARLQIRPMTFDDLPAVQQIERASFTTPWPPHAYRQELATNRLAHYLVAVRAGEIVAYGGVWVMVDEAHVTTFAVHPRHRRQGIGERLLLALLELSIERHAREATLEVRLSNLPARRLYEKYGFRPVGIRPRYYSDNGEDGLIMTTEPLGEPEMQLRIARLRTSLETRDVGARGGGARDGQAGARDGEPGARDGEPGARGGEPVDGGIPERRVPEGAGTETAEPSDAPRVGAQPVATSDSMHGSDTGSGGRQGDGIAREAAP